MRYLKYYGHHNSPHNLLIAELLLVILSYHFVSCVIGWNINSSLLMPHYFVSIFFPLSFSICSKTNTKVIAACRLSARLLERVVLGHTVPDTLQWAVTLAKLSKLSSSSSSSKLSVPIINSTISKRGQKFDNVNPIDSKILKFDNVLGLDDNEIEFLDSILPIEPEIIPCKSYGSCVNEKRIDCHRYDITPQKYDFSNPKDERYDNNRSNISTSRNQSDGKTCHHPSPDAAINHCRKGNDSKNMGKCKIQSVTISSSEKNQTSHTRHHRRSINRGTSNKSIPFSLAVEEIGVTSEVSTQCNM